LKQSELKAILKDHKLWIQSDGKQGKRADLGDTSLQGANLVDANLARAYLYGANLVDANLRGASLYGACLYDASLYGANLQGVNLTGADLGDTSLQGANLVDANLARANFASANLEGAKFTTNFKKVRWFYDATFSEDQIPWVVLNPKYPEWARTLKWVKAKADAA